MNWAKQNAIYERKAYRIVQKHIKLIVNKIPKNNVTLSTYKYLIEANITQEDIKKMLGEVYTTIGLHFGGMVFRQLERIQKQLFEFNEFLKQQILAFLNSDGLTKVVSIQNTLIDTINEAIAAEIQRQGTVIDIARVIEQIAAKSQIYYKWQALRIARTETTFASNWAAMKTGEQSELQLQKQWIATLDNRTRDDHRIENGQMVDFEQPFIMADGSKLMMPGDPKAVPPENSPKPHQATAAQVINCRCTVAFKAKRDENGVLMRKR